MGVRYVEVCYYEAFGIRNYICHKSTFVSRYKLKLVKAMRSAKFLCRIEVSGLAAI